MGTSQKDKTKFRNSGIWKRFRNWKKKESNGVDFVTEKKLYKGWNLHHCDLNAEHYTDISNPDNFLCLNKSTHEVVHWLFRYRNWKEIIDRLVQVMQLMDKLNNRTTVIDDERINTADVSDTRIIDEKVRR